MGASRVLSPERAALLVVDVQERLLPAIHDGERVAAACRVLAEAAARLKLPVVVSEQYPKGLGPTVAAVRAALPDGAAVLPKTAFGCLGDEALAARLKELGRPQVLVCGVEAHVCVNQTVHQLLAAGFQPHLVVDAVGSRSPENKRIGVEKMLGSGAVPSSVETALFELLGDARHPEFKPLQSLVK